MNCGQRQKQHDRTGRSCCSCITQSFRREEGITLVREHLGPVVHTVFLHISYADGGEVCIEDIGSVTGAVHPAVHHFLRTSLTVGDVFTCTAVADTGLGEGSEAAASVGTGMRETGDDLIGAQLCHSGDIRLERDRL